MIRFETKNNIDFSKASGVQESSGWIGDVSSGIYQKIEGTPKVRTFVNTKNSNSGVYVLDVQIDELKEYDEIVIRWETLLECYFQEGNEQEYKMNWDDVLENVSKVNFELSFWGVANIAGDCSIHKFYLTRANIDSSKPIAEVDFEIYKQNNWKKYSRNFDLSGNEIDFKYYTNIVIANGNKDFKGSLGFSLNEKFK